MKRPSWPLVMALVLCAALAGTAYGTLSGWTHGAYIKLRRETRLALGLEKFWLRLPGPGSTGTRSPVACPDPSTTRVLVTGGQSNAANTNTKAASLPADAEVYAWFNGACWRGEDPMPGATGKGGSLWPLLGAALTQDLGQPVLFINGAVGGSQVGDWLDRRSGYLDALLERISAAQAQGYAPELILWHQGESDANVMPDTAEGHAAMRAQLDALSAQLLAAAPSAQLYMFQASKCIGPRRAEGVEAMRAVQRAVAEASPRIIAGLNTDDFGNDYRWDTCHFNSLGRSAVVGALTAPLLDLLRAPTLSGDAG
ncbi:sialate O-acetylesterase [Citreicella sp. C3M06]|uniref:sialate O-acetylesterase n=1 Tax=Citreicella sp. C3M06 TaxID=2841564 RepID=UPI001C0A492D|nr:sialate O-acetylesterase [Citreicella sp. C3M06]MBU2960038.1 sialate O-acetylesterase [Citreicella sp. C3M06]